MVRHDDGRAALHKRSLILFVAVVVEPMDVSRRLNFDLERGHILARRVLREFGA